MIQDYRYLNEWTIKNNYLLPLISDIVENISMKKVFTKLDLWWGYNNVWIKKGDKWKVAFMTLEGSFEPTVIFFGLTNSLETFQMMDEQDPIRLDQHWESSKLHWLYYSRDRRRERTW